MSELGEIKLPRTSEDLLNLPDAYTKLDSGERFLVSAEMLYESVALVFLSDFGKRILKNSVDWCMDGTFSSKPKEFSQLYVIFGSGGPPSSYVYPCAYALLPNKESSTYNHLFSVLLKETEHTPKSIQIDFEQSVIRAAHDVFGTDISIKGCRFHRKKNLFHQVGQKGCLDLFHQDENFQIGLDLIYCLDMVPPDDVVYAWTSVICPFFDEHFGEESSEVEDFLSYVERVNIGRLNERTGRRKQPLFPIPTWNVFQRIMNDEPTTNNSVESWNARWNGNLGTNHNVLRVVTAFKQEDALARTKFQQSLGGHTNPNPKQTGRKELRLAEIKSMMQQYSKINIQEYLHKLRGDN